MCSGMTDHATFSFPFLFYSINRQARISATGLLNVTECCSVVHGVTCHATMYAYTVTLNLVP